jgi:seryl-tRNA synthetase
MTRSILLLSLLLLATTAPTFAQKAKENAEEEKYWKKRIKDYGKNPLILRDEITKYQDEISSLKKEREELKARAATADKSAAQLSNEMAALKTNKEAEVASLQTKLNAKSAAYKELEDKCGAANALTEALTGGNTKRQPMGKDGIAFRVQIGAFAQDTVAFASTDSYVLEVQQEADLSKYVLASFAEYNDATQLKEKLRRLGIRGAFVVAYMSGKRVPVEEALAARSTISGVPAATPKPAAAPKKTEKPKPASKPTPTKSESSDLDEFN